jgi:hypothetical protein
VKTGQSYPAWRGSHTGHLQWTENMHALFEAAIDGAIEGGLDAEWLRDTRLDAVWQRLDGWLRGIHQDRMQDAASVVVGALVIPVQLIPPDPKNAKESRAGKIREGKGIIDDLLKRAAKELFRADNLIERARNQAKILDIPQSLLPDEAFSSFKFFKQEIPKKYPLPSYFHTSPDTVQMLRKMALGLEKGNDIKEAPGFGGHKTSWRGWLEAAMSGIDEAAVMYEKEIPLRQVDWEGLAMVVTDGLYPDGVGRTSVSNAIKLNLNRIAKRNEYWAP